MNLCVEIDGLSPRRKTYLTDVPPTTLVLSDGKPLVRRDIAWRIINQVRFWRRYEYIPLVVGDRILSGESFVRAAVFLDIDRITVLMVEELPDIYS